MKTSSTFVFIYFFLRFSDLNYVEEVKGYSISQLGTAQLVDQRNYIYTRNRKKGNRIFWCCTRKRNKCKGTASTYENYIMNLGGFHNHEPPNIEKMMKCDPLKKDQ